MAKNDIKAGSAYVEILLKNNKFVAGLRASGQALLSFAKGAAIVGAAVGSAAVAVVGAGLSRFMAFGDELDKMRQRTGISVEALSELSHAAGQSGTSIQTVEKGVARMQKGLVAAAAGTQSAADAFGRLGLKVEDLQKMNPEQQFDAVANAIGGIADPSLRAGIAMEVFGRSGAQLLPMIEDMGALRQEARDLGLTMSGDAAASAVRLGDMLANLWNTVKAGAFAIGLAAAPFVEVALPAIQAFATRGLQLIQSAGAYIAANVGTVTAYVAQSWQSLVDYVGPIIGAYYTTLFDYFNAIWEIVQTSFNGIAMIVGSVWGYVGEETGGVMQWLQETVIGALSAISFVFRNWQQIAEMALVSAALSVVRFGNQVAYVFGTVAPEYLKWLGDNWLNVLSDMADLVITVNTNIFKNFQNLFVALAGLFSGDGFDFKPVALLEGFESALSELPAIAERQIGPLEESLQAQLDGLATDIVGEWDRHQEQFKRDAAKFVPKNLEIPALAGSGSSASDVAGAIDATVPSFDNSKKEVFAAFSGAALAAQGQGGGVAGKTLDVLNAIRQDSKQQHREMLAATKDGGVLGE